MSRGESPDLPLFDLPLHDAPQGQEPAEAGDASEDDRASGEQSRLFDDSSVDTAEDFDESGDGGDSGSGVDPLPEDDEVGVLDRLIGGIIDLSIHVLVLVAVALSTWLMGVRLTVDDWPAFAGFLLLFSLLYTGVPLAFWGQTPGMMRVGHVARTGPGEPLTFGQTALRWLGALLTLALAGLPLLLALAGSRSLADRVSGSYTEPA